MINENAVICPLCGNDNKCDVTAVINGGTCWCMAGEQRFPRELLELVAPDQRGQSCICQSCLNKFKEDQLSRPSSSS